MTHTITKDTTVTLVGCMLLLLHVASSFEETHTQLESRYKITGVAPSGLAPECAQNKTIRVGVLARDGVSKALSEWKATFQDYLNTTIPGCEFLLVPLLFEEMNPTVKAGGVDFIYGNPSFYILYNTLYKVRPIVSLKTIRLGQTSTVFGGVLIRKNGSNEDIKTLKDCKGKHVEAVDSQSLGGWQMAWREFWDEGVDPIRDFASLHFNGTHESVVKNVISGHVDVGTFRSDTLEKMVTNRQLNLSDIVIINEQHKEGFPFLLSTRLYPEWPVASLDHVSDALSIQVAAALLSMPSNHTAKRAGKYDSWVLPLNYELVRETMGVLGLLQEYCRPGSYQGAWGECRLCEMMEYSSDPSSVNCTKCPENTITLSLGSDSASDCRCAKGFWRLPASSDTLQCTSCPEGGVCEGIMNGFPLAEKGWWSSKDSPTEFYKCSIFQPCPGGSPETCNTGYEGRMCAGCASGYMRLDTGCHLCERDHFLSWMGDAALPVTLMIVCLILYVSAAWSDLPSKTTPWKSLWTSVIIGINSLQLLLIYIRFNLHWPNLVERAFHVVLYFDLNFNLLYTSCSAEVTWTDIWKRKLIVPMLVMAVYGFFFVLLLVRSGTALLLGPVLRHRKPRWFARNNNGLFWNFRYTAISWFATTTSFKFDLGKKSRKLVQAYIGFLIIAFTTISLNVLQIFECYPQPDGSYSMSSYVQIECYTGKWYDLLGWSIFGILVYLVGIPVGFAIVLWKARVWRFNPKFRETFGFLFCRYKSDYFWWEIVITIRKFMIAGVIANYANKPLYKVVGCFLVVFLSALLHIHFRPFYFEANNYLEESQLLCHLILLMAALVNLYGQNYSATEDTFIGTLALVSIVIATTAFVLSCAYSLYRVYQLQHAVRPLLELTETEDPDKLFQVSRKSSSIRLQVDM